MPGLEAAPPAEQPLRKEGAEASSSSSSRRELVSSAASASLPAPVRAALELAEARRRLLEAESRRRLVSELEVRAHQLHRVFLEAERRLVHRGEGLARLGGGAAQAEMQLASRFGGPRLLRKGLRRARKVRPPALLASAFGLGGCAPWAEWRRARQQPQQQGALDSPRRATPRHANRQEGTAKALPAEGHPATA
nr:PREDICTED: TMF-regulated nuclear protein 1 [Anolis carolinensis]|eukprot:XP_016852914.1 PREDICTED: TMF-regulated nuclear protein 1 [Anolis carolinensis]